MLMGFRQTAQPVYRRSPIPARGRITCTRALGIDQIRVTVAGRAAAREGVEPRAHIGEVALARNRALSRNGSSSRPAAGADASTKPMPARRRKELSASRVLEKSRSGRSGSLSRFAARTPARPASPVRRARRFRLPAGAAWWYHAGRSSGHRRRGRSGATHIPWENGRVSKGSPSNAAPAWRRAFSRAAQCSSSASGRRARPSSRAAPPSSRRSRASCRRAARPAPSRPAARPSSARSRICANRPTRSLSPASARSVAVAARGRRSIDLEIYFDSNSAVVGAKGRGRVATLGEALNDPLLEGGQFMIAGHTDAKGSDGYNQSNSERRALAVGDLSHPEGARAGRTAGGDRLRQGAVQEPGRPARRGEPPRADRQPQRQGHRPESDGVWGARAARPCRSSGASVWHCAE